MQRILKLLLGIHRVTIIRVCILQILQLHALKIYFIELLIRLNRVIKFLELSHHRHVQFACLSRDLFKYKVSQSTYVIPMQLQTFTILTATTSLFVDVIPCIEK